LHRVNDEALFVNIINKEYIDSIAAWLQNTTNWTRTSFLQKPQRSYQIIVNDVF
jgi:hypothetical protein